MMAPCWPAGWLPAPSRRVRLVWRQARFRAPESWPRGPPLERRPRPKSHWAEVSSASPRGSRSRPAGSRPHAAAAGCSIALVLHRGELGLHAREVGRGTGRAFVVASPPTRVVRPRAQPLRRRLCRQRFVSALLGVGFIREGLARRASADAFAALASSRSARASLSFALGLVTLLNRKTEGILRLCFRLCLGPLCRRQARLCACEGGSRLVRFCAGGMELGFHRFPLSLNGREGVSALLGRVGLGTLEVFCASLRLLEFGLGTAQLGLQRPYRLLQFGTCFGRSLTLRTCRLEALARSSAIRLAAPMASAALREASSDSAASWAWIFAVSFWLASAL